MGKRRRNLLGIAAMYVLIAGNQPGKAAVPIAANPDYGKMPLYFIQNQGQLNDRVCYYLQGSDKTVYFAADGLTFALAKNADNPSAGAAERWVVKLDFVGANKNARVRSGTRTAALVSYFSGPCDQWRTGVPTFSSVCYENLWAGVDLVYTGTASEMKYELTVRPGANPSEIRLSYRGATSVEIDSAGQIRVQTPVGGFRDAAPVAWQEIGGERRYVPLTYVLEGSQYGFDVGEYDSTRPLIIDPAVLVYCGFVGGSSDDQATGVAVDGSGNAYITGSTFWTAQTFPVSVGPDITPNGGEDAFVAKLSSDGRSLIYCGYIGGSGEDVATDIAVDRYGNAYIAGYTSSTQTSFPVVAGPDLIANGEYDAFVAKVSSGGTSIIYCGYVGGFEDDIARGIAVDASGFAYIAGYTWSFEWSFPEVQGPDLSWNGNFDGFVAKVNSTGKSLVYCGYIGGNNDDLALGVALDRAGAAYVTGYTRSSAATFPVVGGPYLEAAGPQDAFVAKVSATGSALVYCGYIGGKLDDRGSRIAVDGSGCAYIAGTTSSEENSFPVTVGPALHAGGGQDAFVAKVNGHGSGLVYCGYIGGSLNDEGGDIAVDASGYAYVVGSTDSSESSFPVKDGPDLSWNGEWDAFVAKVGSTGATLGFCGYIGGAGSDTGLAVAVDTYGGTYVVGKSESTEATFPVVRGPDVSANGSTDAFVAKLTSSTLRHSQKLPAKHSARSARVNPIRRAK